MTKWTEKMLKEALENNTDISVVSGFGGKLPGLASDKKGSGMFSGARRTVSECGEVFQSKGEYDRWMKLKLYEKCGIISNLTRQNKWIIQYGYTDEDGKKIRDSTWTDDFQYICHSHKGEKDKWIIEDWKRGSQTNENKRIVDIVKKKYRVKIIINDGDLSLIPESNGNSIKKMEQVKKRISEERNQNLQENKLKI